VYSDFYQLESLLTDEERATLLRVRDFMSDQVDPVINEAWTKARFPHELVPGYAQLGIAGAGYLGPARPLLDGMISMEIARVDPSFATFHGVHGGLAMGSVALCGSPEQGERWLPAMAAGTRIGAFGLTEPNVGSGASRGLETTARRDGKRWILNGAKNWIGNASFADLIVIWARDVADNQVKGFMVERGTPGLSTEVLKDKIALRVVQNARIELVDVVVDEANRLQRADSFRDTAKVLQATRAGVAWMAVGCALGAYENALEYSKSREQFGRPIGSFQLVQDLLVRMLGNITASASLCVQLARLQEDGAARDEHSSLAKAFCTTRMRESVGWARELMGGNGILLEHNVGRFVADSEAIYSYEGTREMNTLIVGKAITGFSAFV
jgi:glutaryl-CoA dehydrogenase